MAIGAAALIGVAAPASAQVQPTWIPLGTIADIPGSGAVTRFYERRANALIWFRLGPRNPATGRLLQILHASPVDGLASGPQLARRAEDAIRQAQSGHPAAMLAADKLLSTAWVQYVQALRRSPEGTQFGTATIMPRTGVDAILSELAAAPALGEHLTAVAQVNPIYAELRQEAITQYRRWGVVDSTLQVNLDRTRVLPPRGRFVLVNIASARLFMIEDGRVQDSMKVIVGKAEKQTPMLASMIHYATFNPYWNVPDDLVKELIAPNVLRQGMPYLRDRGYEVVLNWSENAPVLDPSKVDWRAIAAGREMVRVRQRPGPANSMGNLKFSFPNGEGIYLHDTPNKELFEKNLRALSAGCVRLEDAERLAAWLMRRDPRVATVKPETHVQLPQGVPIYLTHLTAQASGALAQSSDIFAVDGEREGG